MVIPGTIACKVESTKLVLSGDIDAEMMKAITYDDDYEDEDEEELSGAIYFSRRVGKKVVPKGFKIPTDKIKYEGVQ
jgi:hypothetical protein